MGSCKLLAQAGLESRPSPSPPLQCSYCTQLDWFCAGWGGSSLSLPRVDVPLFQHHLLKDCLLPHMSVARRWPWLRGFISVFSVPFHGSTHLFFWHCHAGFVTMEIRYRDASSVALFAQDCFGYLGSFCAAMWISGLFFYFCEVSQEFWCGLRWICRLLLVTCSLAH
jgi:hypothetical protein